MPGEADVHVAILRQVEKIEDEDLRKKAIECLKANDAGISKALKTHGARGDAPVDAGSPEGQLDTLAKNRAKTDGTSFAKAYDAVMQTAEGKALYGQMVVHAASSDTE